MKKSLIRVGQQLLELQVTKQTDLNFKYFALFEFTQLYLMSRRKTAFRLAFETTQIIEFNWVLWTNLLY